VTPRPTAPLPRHRTEPPRAFLAAILIALVASACVNLELSGEEDTSDPESGAIDGDPGDCTLVDVAVSSEKIDLLTDLARTFNAASERGEDGFTTDAGCIFVRPATKASGLAATLLAEGWDEASEGPRPVIWSPASSSWGALVNHELSEQGEPPMVPDSRPFMLSPLVIAVPEPMAEALGHPDEAIGWEDVLELATDPDGWAAFDRPEFGPFKLGKTNPHFSTSGLSALIAQYHAATGKTSGLTVEDVRQPEVAAYAAGIESAVTHYGDTTLTFLNNLYRNDARGSAMAYASAVAVEEVSVVNYNRGNPDGVLQPGEVPEEPRVPLVAIYPKEGTLFSDNPFIVLDAEWVTDDQRAAAARFEDYVQQPENQERVLEFGFRPGNPAVAIGAPITPDLGVDPDQPQTTLQTPDPAVLAAVLDQWDAQRKAARVLLTVDVSGSMGDPVSTAEGRTTKLDLAKRAAVTALDQFRDDDEVGLRLFTSGLGADGQQDWVDVVPIGPMGEVREDLRRALEGLVPLQGTPLYAAVADSYEVLFDGYDDAKINAVVVLSDGQDDGYSDVRLEDALERLQRGGEGATVREVRVFPIGYGDDADMTTLRRLAEATDAAAYDATDARSIDRVFEAVVSNF
jgi:Ca-activated chloride channel homolog